jgi:hypothetical protein
MLGSNIRYLSLRSHCHDVSIRSITTRIHVKDEKEESLRVFGMNVYGKTRTRRPLPVPC